MCGIEGKEDLCYVKSDLEDKCVFSCYTKSTLKTARLSIIVVVVLATLFSLFAPDTIFNRVVFAWTALGAAFVPMVLSKVFKWDIPAKSAFYSVISGFLLTILFHFLPDTPGDIVERIVPMSVGLSILYFTRIRDLRSNN